MAQYPKINNRKQEAIKKLTNEQSVPPHCVCQSITLAGTT